MHATVGGLAHPRHHGCFGTRTPHVYDTRKQQAYWQVTWYALALALLELVEHFPRVAGALLRPYEPRQPEFAEAIAHAEHRLHPMSLSSTSITLDAELFARAATLETATGLRLWLLLLSEEQASREREGTDLVQLAECLGVTLLDAYESLGRLAALDLLEVEPASTPPLVRLRVRRENAREVAPPLCVLPSSYVDTS